MSTTVRDVLFDAIRKEIFGPHEEDERLKNSDHPRVRYLSGVLYPIETLESEKDTKDELTQIRSAEENSGEVDEKVPVNVGRKPSSMGMTCNVQLGCRFVSALISYGRYDEIEEQDIEDDISEESTESGRKDSYWQRSGREWEHRIDLEKPFEKINLEEDIFFRYHTQRKDGHVILNVFLTNEGETKVGVFAPDDKCVFQARIQLTSTDSSKVFRNISKNDRKKIDGASPHDREMEFLYRDRKYFAQGHSCSVEWNTDERDDETDWVQTTFVPSCIVPEIAPREFAAGKVSDALSMKMLAGVTDHRDYKDILLPIAEAYEKWIGDLENQRLSWETDPECFERMFVSESEDIPKSRVKDCKDALARILEGINVISEDPLAGEAFRFTNEAMYQSISHTRWAKTNREKILRKEKITEDNPDSSADPKWRMFQLAFLLLTLESVANPSSVHRNTADLLWFPTGGGKTEAYFGIITFTMAYRRLRGKDIKTIEGELDRYGVSVIMRYTYRLLTLQQFQRAATLFCACEYIRLKNSQNIKKFGSQPFLVGLWAGKKTTPNSFAEAKKIIQETPRAENTNPIQLHSCPWCGRELDEHNYEWRQDTDDPDRMRPRRIQIRCDNRCFFGQPGAEHVLPVVLVDEDIRNLCPSLLISTVDKFAQLSWNWEYSVFFGNVHQYCKQHGYSPGNTQASSQKICHHQETKRGLDRRERKIVVRPSRKLAPPEMIIQDELHLITGPLGTLAGLYETAVNLMCTNKATGARPKIIASTATAKTSGDQLKLLFNSESTKIFPPQEFEFGDSYFAEVFPPSEEHPGKLYVGVCPASVGLYHADSRISSSILRKIRHIRENNDGFHFGGKISKFGDDDLDPYYTVVNYYNTIKSLGAAVRMYEDTIPGNMEVIIESIEKKFQTQNNAPQIPVEILQKEELTGRIGATKIPEILQKVETRLTDETPPLDALLCTNMLSVGVDIDRLSVMVMNGQPKSTSEYIQATGRIGRKNPGIVVVNYSYMRPRDLSHFENFVQFHSTYHKLVEPGTLTPFSRRARDRGLAGVFMALARLSNRTLSENPMKFDPENPDVAKTIEEVMKSIIDRVSDVNPHEVKGTTEDLRNIVTKWCDAISGFERWTPEGADSLRYRRSPYKKTFNSRIAYLLDSSREPYNKHAFVIPESLRDAESEITLYYSKRYRGDDHG